MNMKMQASKKVLEACFSCGRLDMLIWGRVCLEHLPEHVCHLSDAPLLADDDQHHLRPPRPLPAFAWQMFGVETQAMQLEWNNMEHPVSVIPPTVITWLV